MHSNIYNAAIESAEPSTLDGPIPLPPVQLPSFITGNGAQAGAITNPWQSKLTRPASTKQASINKGKGKARASSTAPGLDGEPLALFEEFCQLTPGDEDAEEFFNRLPKKLAALGEGSGQLCLKKDSFLWNAWRHAWSNALGMSPAKEIWFS
jgi:hypothetical protein